MTNPVVTTVTKGSWVKVATNKDNLGIVILKQTAIYAYTYRDTGDPAPTLISEGGKMSFPGHTFQSANAFDLYIWCVTEDGVIRIDEDFTAEYLIDA